MPSLAKTWGDLLEEVKKEARVKGTDNLNGFILDTVNEILYQQTSRQQHFELYEPDYEISMADGSRSYSMPSDFQHLSDVRFSADGSVFKDLPNRNDYHLKVSANGTPRFYELAGSSLRVFPYADVDSDMKLQIDYYRAPTLFTLDGTTEQFPIPKLYNAIKRDTIARTHLYYKEFQSAQAFGGGATLAANESEARNETK